MDILLTKQCQKVRTGNSNESSYKSPNRLVNIDKYGQIITIQFFSLEGYYIGEWKMIFPSFDNTLLIASASFVSWSRVHQIVHQRSSMCYCFSSSQIKRSIPFHWFSRQTVQNCPFSHGIIPECFVQFSFALHHSHCM